MVVSETLTCSALMAGDPDLRLDNFTALSTTEAFQLGLVGMKDGAFDSGEKVEAAVEAETPIRFDVAPDRLGDMAWHFRQKTGIDFNLVTVKGGAGVMNGLRGGDADIGWVAGAQSKPVQQGEMVNIARGIATPLADSLDAASVTELGNDFYLDGSFMFIAPAERGPAAREVRSAAIEDVLEDGVTAANALVTKRFGGATVIAGDDLDAYMQTSKADVQALLASVSQ